jgi:hypothetical protein
MIFPLADWQLGATISVRFKTLSSSGLGHSPFTGVTRVRIPLGSLYSISGLARNKYILNAAAEKNELERELESFLPGSTEFQGP